MTTVLPPEWLGATVNYEGSPLALRVRPGAGTPAQRARLAMLAVVTHRLAHVRPDGMPEPDYNDGLAALDGEIIAALQSDGGVVAIVETLGGRRSYYAYTRDGAGLDAPWAALRAAHPGHALELQRRDDPEWAVFLDYRKRFRF